MVDGERLDNSIDALGLRVINTIDGCCVKPPLLTVNATKLYFYTNPCTLHGNEPLEITQMLLGIRCMICCALTAPVKNVLES